MPRAKCGKSTERTVDFYLTECRWLACVPPKPARIPVQWVPMPVGV